MYELFAGRLLAVRGEFLAGGEDAVQAYVAQRAQVRVWPRGARPCSFCLPSCRVLVL